MRRLIGMVVAVWVLHAPGAVASPGVIDAPLSLQAGSAATLRVAVPARTATCAFSASSGMQRVAPARYRAGGRLVSLRWRIPANAAAATWTLRVGCARTAAALSRAKPFTTPFSVRALAGARKRRVRLLERGTLRVRSTTPTGALSGLVGPSGYLPGAGAGKRCAGYLADRGGYCEGFSAHYAWTRRGDLARLGHARDWMAAAKARGVPTGPGPAIGAVAWWAGRVAGGFGHVAYVERTGAGTITVSEMNGAAWGRVRSRTIRLGSPDAPAGYIYGPSTTPGQGGPTGPLPGPGAGPGAAPGGGPVDPGAPTVTSVEVPAGWSGTDVVPVTVHAHGALLGVGSIELSAPRGSTPLVHSYGCLASALLPCPGDWTQVFSLADLPEGASEVEAVAADPLGHRSAPSTASVRVDRRAPTIDLGGPLADADGMSIAEPGSLHAAARDVTSGVVRLEILLDGERDALAEQTCGSGACSLARDWTLPAAGLADGPHTVTIVAEDAAGRRASSKIDFTWRPNGTPPAPLLDPTEITPFAEQTAFLYSGPRPVQTGVDPGTIEDRRAAVIRGTLTDRSGAPVGGARVTVTGHPELGATTSRDDGEVYMVVNGGGQLGVHIEHADFLPVDRQLDVPWQGYAFIEDTVLVHRDPNVTAIDTSAPLPAMVAHRSSVEQDAVGKRQATLLFPRGLEASMEMPDGSTRPLPEMHVRATEYTVGQTGPAAMPAPLPATSAYTYAADFGVDEARAAGAAHVRFTKPVVGYLENFRNAPVGGRVPNGYYERSTQQWVPDTDGRVVKVLSESAGLAALDVTGGGQPASAATLATIGIDEDELRKVAELYEPGQELWRVPTTHFSDWNYGPRVLGAAQPAPAASFQGVVPDPCTDSGSVIECENQTLGEDVPVNGSAVALHYRSDRVPGRTADRNAIEIPLTGATLPAGLVGVELRIDVAGRRFEWRDGRAFAAQPNLSHRFAWDGKDEFGRTLQGAQQARVSVGYVYGISYRTDPLSPEDARRGFGVPPDGSPYEFAGLGGAGAGGAAVASLDWWQRPHIVVWRPNDTTLGGWDARAAGLGGWTLTPHHQYDPVSKTMYRGDGSKRSVTTVDRVINRFAGTGSSDPSSTTGTQATKTSLFGPEGMDVGPDGSVYIADFYNDVVRRVAPDGTIAIVAGRQRPSFYSPRGFSGDGGPATQADIYIPTDVDVAADGSLFITDYGNHRIRKVDSRGIITTVAGGADPYASDIGDGKPATQASLRYPNATEVAPDGTLFILDRDHYRIRRVGPDGIITTYAGGGDQGADDIPATKYYFHWYYEPLRAMALAPDGSLYVATSAYLRRIGPDGFIKRVAGDGRYSYEYNVNEKRTVAPALDATITTRAVTVSSDGTVYFTDPGNKRIWRLDNDGKVRVVAGDGNGSNPGGNADGGPALEGHLDIPQGLAVGPDGAMYVSDWSQNNVRRISDPLPGFDGRDIAIPSEDGRELYRFDATGRHLETRDTSNGTVIARFGYDDRGRLASIEDAHANVIRVQRDAAGQPLAIVAPFGQRTTLGVGSDGFLASIADPAGRSWALGYERAGLLTSFARPGGATSRMQYAADGRLIRDENADGGVKTLARTDTPGTYEVTLSTSLGRTRTAGVVRTEAGATLRTATAADGVSTQTRTNGDGSQTTTRTDGSKVSTHGVRDPRFGLQAPYLDSVATTRPSGATSTVTSSRAVDLADENDVLSVRSIVSSSKAGSRTTTTRWDRAAGTTTTTLPSGLAAVLTADASGQVLRSHTPGIADVTYDYDAYGRRTATHQGERTSTVTYDAAGRVASSTDPLGRTTRYERDALGRVTTATLPDGREVRMTYDAAGDLRSVTPPSRPAHGFLYTLTGLRSSWQAAGDASAVTRYGYDADQQLTSIERADGTTTALDRDSAGRLSAMRRGGWLVDYDYDAASGLLASVTGDDGTKTSWTYDGTLPRSETTTGAVAGQAQIDYDADGRVVSSAVNGTPAVTFAYDADGAPTRIGDLAFTRSATTGQLTGTALGDSTTAFGYDGYGGLAALQASQAGAALFAESYERDRAGRVTKRTETVGGETHEHEYGYDAAGRLASVKRDGTTVATYAFDQNGNRVTVDAAGSAPVSADFDDQDRLLRQGTTAYRYTAAGELRERTTGDGAATRYSYDAAGSLTGVELPDGRVLSYLTDGVGRRIGTKVDGVLERGFVYGETGLPSAELDGDGAVRSRFVYGTRTAVPEYMQRGGRTYRIVSDQLGSVRLVVDVQSGEVAQRIDYDPFGRVVADSSPGFQPFGYAGGLYDPRTGLVRFGQRDYDAQTGRWTAKDPVDFAGSDTNLYGYVLGDPINRIDPTGLFPSFEDFANSTVGTFDALSFGYTKWVRDRTYEPLGLHDGTGYCSQQYRWGHIGGEIDRDLAVATFTGNGITGLAMYLGRGPVAAGMIGGAGGSAISTSLGTGGDPVKTLASAALGGFGGGLTAAVFPSAPTTRLIEVYTDEMWGPAVGGASSSMAYGAGTTAGGQSGSGCSCP